MYDSQIGRYFILTHVKYGNGLVGLHPIKTQNKAADISTQTHILL